MLWYKSWLETRWRFFIGLALLMCSAAAMVFTYPRVRELLPLAPPVEVGGELGRRIREAMDLSREYRGYIWSQGFRQNLAQMGTLFAVLLGTGGLVSGGAALFTLSLPVSRRRLLGTRAAAGLGEWLVLALVPALFIPLLSPAVGESFSVTAALVHGFCLFVAGAVFFSLALLLSTIFADVWRPLLIALTVAVVLAGLEAFGDLSTFGVYSVMSGDAYFRTGALPWAGLFVSAAASAAMLYSASANIANRDF
jgi:ABC-2 type transport system permease protein